MSGVSLQSRARQAWTIARIELRRVFFARRSLWVYALALLPSVIFFVHGLEGKFRSDRLARRGQIPSALMDSPRNGESVDDIKARLGKAAEERWSTRSQRVRKNAGNAGTTTHPIEPTVEARFVRLNINRPTYSGEPLARIYEFEVYGPATEPGQGAGGAPNLALKRRANCRQCAALGRNDPAVVDFTDAERADSKGIAHRKQRLFGQDRQ